ncbi:MAG TPA: 2'-5' RNA ligase family protein [Gaiellaceae bacterium]|nr:2'-5' RNA ligase family protein [Gaiellaceae bacterium]
MPPALWRRLRAQARTALVVPVPAAEPIIGPLRERHDPSAAAGMPAHVTVLYPFAPTRALDGRVEAELESLVSGFPPFEYRLERFGRFPGVLYLQPEPARPFVALTQTIHERWPEYPPYEGAYDEIIPHLTVAAGPEPERAEAEIAAQLPLTTRAEELWVMTKSRGRTWVLRRALPLGGG